MKSMHLFAGAGGGLLSDLILGDEPIIAVEWDKYACEVLRQRAKDGWFPGLQVWEGDVRMFDPSEYAGIVDCIHAGFPCQDISNAGKQAGLGEGTRSGLYREVLRIAGILKPSEIRLENVSAIVSMGGSGIGTVVADLSAMGYDCRWLTLRASDVGANHHRDRWWCLAARRDIQRDVAFTNGIGHLHSEFKEQPAERKLDALCDVGTSGENVAYSNSIGQSRSREYVGQVNPTQDSDRKADCTINSSKRVEGWWNVEPGLGRVVDVLADTMDRLKAIGNGQVPLQAAVAFTILKRGLYAKP